MCLRLINWLTFRKITARTKMETYKRMLMTISLLAFAKPFDLIPYKFNDLQFYIKIAKCEIVCAKKVNNLTFFKKFFKFSEEKFLINWLKMNAISTTLWDCRFKFVWTTNEYLIYCWKILEISIKWHLCLFSIFLIDRFAWLAYQHRWIFASLLRQKAITRTFERLIYFC